MPFSSPPNPRQYNERVYEIVRAIPAGRVMSYGQIARLIPPVEGVPVDAYLRLAPRWVGGAMAVAPDDVPWQRVINSQGKVSNRPGFGPMVQRNLLEQEDVVFDPQGRVDLASCGWRPDRAWVVEHGYLAWDETQADKRQPRLF